MEKKHFIFIMAFLSFILCIFFIQESYAKYLTATSENATMNVARWRILVNNKDIREGSTTNAIITPVFEGNEHIANGIIEAFDLAGQRDKTQLQTSKMLFTFEECSDRLKKGLDGVLKWV